MPDLLRVIIPAFFLLFCGITFVLKSVVTWRKIGKNPVVLPKDQSPYGLIGMYFKWTMILLCVYVICYAFFPDMYVYFLPIFWLDHAPLKWTGLILLAISFCWTVIAQNHMRNSWRVGIDAKDRTELITTGLFAYSRNPIFLGIVMSLIGLFLVTPNALTMLFMTIGHILIQIQIRLEEEHLESLHGEKYVLYKTKVRRFIGKCNH